MARANQVGLRNYDAMAKGRVNRMQHEDLTDDQSEGKSKRLRSASNSKLPVASVIPDREEFKRAVALLREAGKIKVAMSEGKERLDEIEMELHCLCVAYDLNSGLRHGLFGFEDRGMKSKSTLKKDKLVNLLSEFGIPAARLSECYESGSEFLDTRITAFDLE